MAPVYMSSYFSFTQSAHEKTTRSQCSNTLIAPLWNINAGGKRTFQYRAATLWNRLPVDVRSKFTDMSLNEFESVVYFVICMIFIPCLSNSFLYLYINNHTSFTPKKFSAMQLGMHNLYISGKLGI